jgi:NADPH:quinone reductase-like Zn-dependent oxidoreductase
MISLKDVQTSNASFKEKAIPGLVALFIGGTSGVGKGTLIQFAKNANYSTVHVVGRSKASATPLLNELETLNPNGTFTFIETQIS